MVRVPHRFPPRSVPWHALTLPFAIAGDLWTRPRQELLIRYGDAGGEVGPPRRCRTIDEVMRVANAAGIGDHEPMVEVTGGSAGEGSGIDPEALADEVDRRIRALAERGAEPVRRIRREYSKALRRAPAGAVVALALALADRQRWVAYELVAEHPGGLDALGLDEVERLGRGMADWGAVDAFGCILSGPAWRRGRIPDEAVHRWGASPDRWWRRAALVSTVPLNVRSRGGTGDAARTLDVCARLAGDRDAMVVKALSWALRELVLWDPAAVRAFLATRDGTLAALVKREVRAKLDTGRKRPRGPAGA